MNKYIAPPFTVILTWFEGNKVHKKKFNKYIEAVAWANENLVVDRVIVKIMGQLIFKE